MDLNVNEKLGDIAADAGLTRVNILAWRDLDDPEAGGSERHAAEVARRFAEAGIEVTMRTSSVANRRREARRDGYRIVRKAGRYMVFPRAAFSERMGWHGRNAAIVEIWNGMPFFSPLWATGPRAAIVHHVHKEMWELTLSPRLAKLGRVIEERIAPRVYRNTEIVTVSESTKRELVDDLGLLEERIQVVRNGIDECFGLGLPEADVPLIAAVGRLVPVKRFDLLLDALAIARRTIPNLRAVLAGDGYERDALLEQRRALGAEEWIDMPGRLRRSELIALYQRAWVHASTSLREGWGMTIVEAAACGTPAVATRVPGHVDSVVDDVTGLLADATPEAIAATLVALCNDHERRARLAANAHARATQFSWDATARGVMEALARDAQRRAHA
ncbi:MAG: glycosyltransferase family 4 protein [Acidimicrobiia bacterium]